MGGISVSHWVIVAVLLLLFFGPRRLPAAGQAIGEALRSFCRAFEGGGIAPEEEAAPEKIADRKDDLALRRVASAEESKAAHR
jgi:sec-independent protein translocase protein TatA